MIVLPASNMKLKLFGQAWFLEYELQWTWKKKKMTIVEIKNTVCRIVGRDQHTIQNAKRWLGKIPSKIWF